MKKFSLALVFLAAASLFFIFSQPAKAAVTEATPATELITSGQKIKLSSNYTPIFGFSLIKTASETLSSVTMQLVGTVTPTDIAGLRVYADDSNTGANNDVIDAGDTICGTQTTVNVGAPTTISTGTCAIPASGTGAYDFIVATATSATITDGKTISFAVATGTNTYILSSGTVSATALTAANTLTAAPAVSSVSAFTDRIIINFNENIDGMTAMNCANYIVNGTAVACGGFGLPYVEFNGNKATIKNLTLSGTVSLSIPANNTIKGAGANTTLIAYSNSSITAQILVLPTISSISPTTGAVSDSVTITGTNFGADPGGSHTDANHKVFFSGGFSQSTGPLPPIEAASYTSWSNTSIVVVVPTGAKGGPVNIMVNGAMSDMNQNSFFDIKGNYTAQIYYSTDTSDPMLDADKNNIRIIVAGPNGIAVHKVGDGAMTYSNGTPGTFTITGVISMGQIWAFDVTGGHLNSPGAQVDTSAIQELHLIATTRTISGTITLGTSCVNAGKNQNVVVMANPDGVDTGASGFKGVQPAFFTTGPLNGQTQCQTTYTIGVPINGAYRVEAHIPPNPNNTTVSSSSFTDPSTQFVTISNTSLTASSINFTFTSATHKIVGSVTKPSGTLSTTDKGMLWVFAYQPVGGKGTGTQVAADGSFTLNVSKGTWKVGIGGPNMPPGSSVEKTVNVDDTYLISSFTAPTLSITISPPSNYIEGYVKDSAGNGLSNVGVYAFVSNGPGGGNASTDSQGYYKMYVNTGTYTVGANSSSYGRFTEQSNIAVASSTNPTVNFTVSSSNYTISGAVTKGGQALQQAYVFITSGQNGQMMGGGMTGSDGSYSFGIPGGSSYWIHVGVMGKGEIYKASLGSVSANATNNISVTSSTITIRIWPASLVSNAFVGAHGSAGGGMSSASIVTSTCTGSGSSCKEYQIDVARGAAYIVEGGVDGYGPLSQASVTVSAGGSFTETSGTANDGVVEYNLSTSLYTVSGIVSGDDVSSAYVWASSSNGGGGTQVNSDGTYTLNLKNGAYSLGVNKDKYMATSISITVNGANLSGQNLTLTSASSTITGTVYLPDGTTTVTNARVWASNGSGGFAMTTTSASGTYTLNVGSGSWTVDAAYDGYNANSTAATAPAAGVNFTLAAISGFSSSVTNSSITPSNGGVVQNSRGIKVDFAQNALGTSSSATVQMQKTTNVPTSTSTDKIVGTPETVTATVPSSTGSSTQTVTTLSGTTTISFPISKSELTTAGISTLDQVNKIAIKYLDTTSNLWVQPGPTTVALNPTTAAAFADLSSDVAAMFTVTTSHLSDFALSSPSGLIVLDTPTNFTATSGNGQATLAWSAVSGATKYDIYKKLGDLYPYLAQAATTSYTATGLTNNTTYYFKVSALNDSNDESAATSAVSVTPAAPSSGGGGGALLLLNTSSSTPSTNPATTLNPAKTPTLTPAQQNDASQIFSQHLFTKNLKLGSISPEVKILQQYLNTHGFLVAKKGPGSLGNETNKFGSLTKKAVIKFQENFALDILTPLGLKKGTGMFYASTRKKLNSLLAK